MSQDIIQTKRALISLSDKVSLERVARQLVEYGVEILSTGGTAKALETMGIAVIDVAQITNFPEMMDGRVKTLHPMVHGGLLALRDLPSHAQSMREHNIQGIDLLWVNLYPFEETLDKGSDFDTCIENIDIGGPAMIRAGAKNHGYCAVATDDDDIELVLADLAVHKGTTHLVRKTLAARAYSRTAAYDAAISNWYMAQLGETSPKYRTLGGKKCADLRYGENPHQKAAYYSSGEKRYGVASAKQLQGKELSYNNYNDTDAAYELVTEFDPAQKPAIAIIKHANPCGVAVGETMLTAYQNALGCDPVSAFGGIIACNGLLDAEAAVAMVEVFTEVVIAPQITEEAIEIFAKKKNLRLLLAGGLPNPNTGGANYRTIAGGFLVQDRDNAPILRENLKVVTKRTPSDKEIEDLIFAFKIAKHVKSNAIVYAKDLISVGIGAGQMNRRDSAFIAAKRAVDAAKLANWGSPKTIGSACASDAFFPFADGLLEAVAAGATSVIQPGGSIRDDEVIKAADEAGIAMVFTGQRHFRH
ncbi:MAG: phosphoribosylaminoimidazolecarboxamide formyltransferase / IMP cyclohydrolase [Hyphomonadaceae bacterium]|nr:MAG: phosphoribosylaminoimidazolecarboxamide formyltransferase / IMP cyclohydrolase [Hyphomonadaceae bacterium]KAF0187138.1 MAG: phosphoribosylaminoimidazolecarboxamide formyltransferase / IMP cyclohydrolase [Hyphomonadaceae bacterium]